MLEFRESSGNVFADLGLPNPEERLAKADLMIIINAEIKRRGLRQAEAAAMVGLRQPDISNIARGLGISYSMERLLTVLGRLGMEVEITARRRRNGAGTVVVRRAV
ncbi:MAG: XRE family transcriptional regulator [Candidatus Eremiobacteraeota bacterium]|nr:XRE family transcriptional regulator [Candidatus Eremiobacteraeota bacterium]